MNKSVSKCIFKVYMLRHEKQLKKSLFSFIAHKNKNLIAVYLIGIVARDLYRRKLPGFISRTARTVINFVTRVQ